MDTPPNIMKADMVVVRLKYCKKKNVITYVGISMKPLLKIDTEYIVHLVDERVLIINNVGYNNAHRLHNF